MAERIYIIAVAVDTRRSTHEQTLTPGRSGSADYLRAKSKENTLPAPGS